MPNLAPAWQFWTCLWGFAVAALALRVTLATAFPNIHRPDEIFQNLEPAHRLWSGWGVVTWEWRDGIRSWFLPGALAALMSVSTVFGQGPETYLAVIAIALSLLSLGVVVTGVVLGWRHSGPLGAVLCGVLCSFWPDLVYFAPKPLAEIQAGNLLVIAAGLAIVFAPGTAVSARARRASCLAIGALLGLAFSLRFQLAPALLVIAVWAGRRDLRQGWLLLLLGAALPLGALGVCDFLTLGSPFQSIWKNIEINLFEHRSEIYGVEPPYWYGVLVLRLWRPALLPVTVFFLIGAPRARLMALISIVVVGFHSLIPHKEISFIYAALPPALIVAGIGTARVVMAAAEALRSRVSLAAMGFAASLLWAVVAAYTADHSFRPLWFYGHEMLPIWKEARSRPDLCGLGLYGARFPWHITGGYALLDRPAPIYLLRSPAALGPAGPGINYLIAANPPAPELHSYETVMCGSDFCLLHRPQGCIETPAYRIDAVLADEGS